MGISAGLGMLTILPLLNGGSSMPQALAQGLGSFKTYSQMQSFIAANAKSAQQYSRVNGGGLFLGMPIANGVATSSATFAAAATTDSTQSPSSPTFTGTNDQVKGVDEPDIVKTDGVRLFVATSSSVSIINANSNLTSILSTLSFSNSNILGIEIAQDRLFVIDQKNTNATYIDLLLYNTMNPSNPLLIQNTTIEGNYVSARLSGNYVYTIIQQPSYTFDNGNANGAMPTVTNNAATSTLPPSSVYYSSAGTQIRYYTMIVSMNMLTGGESTTSVLTGPSSTIYVSLSNIYVVYANYELFYADNIPGDVFSGGVITPGVVQQGGQNSTIFRVSYSNGNVAVEAGGTVPGTVLNQFSLDEYNGYFRVATSRTAEIGSSYTRSDDVYVLNMNMSQVSAIRNIAPGENIYAVSFVGDMGYVVTFQQVDPLFAISFKDMNNPVIVSALKVSGYSDYLYPLPNGYLIGVGKDAVPSSTGNFSYYLGLKISLFHVLSNGTSAQVSKYPIGDRGTDSPVLTDHLAFTFDSTRNVMVIPLTLAIVSGSQSYDPNSPPPFGDYVWQGVYVFHVSTSDITLLGKVSQYSNGTTYGDSPNYNLQIDRSVIIGNSLYTISAGEVMVSDLSTFTTLATVLLPQ
ncbi:MAG TPA: beta-propeller domain-containing protein [Nitrososphaerales archaeon]|nr:beta-propeller domain-containing protein [Nitrososphaerales archaeon]